MRKPISKNEPEGHAGIAKPAALANAPLYGIRPDGVPIENSMGELKTNPTVQWATIPTAPADGTALLLAAKNMGRDNGSGDLGRPDVRNRKALR